MRNWRRDEIRLLALGLVGFGGAASYSCGGSNGAAASAASTGGGSNDSPSGDGSPASSEGCTSDAATAQNTAAVVAATEAFLTALTDEQRTAARVTRSQANALQWSNFPAGVVRRNGVRLADMSAAAQSAAVALAKVAAGDAGMTMLSEVRSADDAYRTVSGNTSLFGAGQYYFSVHGAPSTSASWMLQIAGHHLAYDFSYNGKCTSATPLFDGAQPAIWTDSDGDAHDPIASQRDAMAALYAAVGGLDGARLSGTYSDMINGPAAMMGGTSGGTDSRYPSGLTYPTASRGADVSQFTVEQRTLVKSVIEAWVKNAADPVSKSLLALYEDDDALSRTYVGYSGSPDLSTTSSYGRIDGPRVWIEFTVQEGTAGGAQGHYHTIWRDKAADYGADFVAP